MENEENKIDPIEETVVDSTEKTEGDVGVAAPVEEEKVEAGA